MNTTEEVQKQLDKLPLLKEEIHKTIIGQSDIIDQLLIGLLAKGHVLLEGLPGLAKTLLVKTLSQTLDLTYNRIQFTPDLMPADILGTEVIEEDIHGHKSFNFRKGPVFTHVLLADEINRTPPKTQAALLEVMQEYRVTYAGKEYLLPTPYFILATQNPIEQSGTFPLPEAQLDRFLLFVRIGYPSLHEEEQIYKSTTSGIHEIPSAVLSSEEIVSLQKLTREVHIDSGLIHEITKWVRQTRPEYSSNATVKDYVAFGAGPRAGQALILAAKACALLHGRFSVIPEDIKRMIFPAIRHRLVLNYRAEAEQISSDNIIEKLNQGSIW